MVSAERQHHNDSHDVMRTIGEYSEEMDLLGVLAVSSRLMHVVRDRKL